MFSPMFSEMFSPMFGPMFPDASGWTPPTGNTYPTAFSPYLRGGIGTTQGMWADNNLRTVRHANTLDWKSIRAMAGITTGQKVSCWATVDGTDNEIGIGLGNSSVDLESYSGSTADGICLFGHVNDVYSNGGSVATTTGTLAQTDRVRMDVDRVANTVRFYRQAGGSGAFSAMCDAIDISGLGSDVLYPVASGYRDTGVVTWEFGNGAQVPPSGFTAGPLGSFGFWSTGTLYASWLYDDFNRMWETNTGFGTVAPNVVDGDPVGGWLGAQGSAYLSTSVSANRPEKIAGGVRFDSTGGLKQINMTLTRDSTLPFTAAILTRNQTGDQIRFGFGTSVSAVYNGIPNGGTTKQRVVVRGTTTILAALSTGSERFCLVTCDGTNAYALDADGTWSAVSVGSGSTAISHIFMRAPAADAIVSTVAANLILTTSVNETEARNIKWMMEQTP